MRDLSEILSQRDAQILNLERFPEKLTPFCARMLRLPIPHCPIEVDDENVSYHVGGAAIRSPSTLCGHPATVVPLIHSTGGLPISLQIVGVRWSEMTFGFSH